MNDMDYDLWLLSGSGGPLDVAEEEPEPSEEDLIVEDWADYHRWAEEQDELDAITDPDGPFGPNGRFTQTPY